MKTIVLSLLLSGIIVICDAQDYTIQHFQAEYDTLTDYNSLSIELALAGEYPYSWEESFEFGFDFPFYGDTFSEVIMDNWAVGYFPESPEYNFNFFACYYTIEHFQDITYLQSEIRYKQTTSKGLKALVIEFHNVYYSPEYDDNGTNHFINFQTWFFENGVMELHIGPIDLTDCSRYYPGAGFSLNDINPKENIHGPWVKINNNDFSKSACFAGDHTDPMILYNDYDNIGVLTSVPPEGYIIKFLPESVSSTADMLNEMANNFDVIQHDGRIQITDSHNCFESCKLYDLQGRKLGQTHELEFKINSTLPQIILLIIMSECGQEVHKVWVNHK